MSLQKKAFPLEYVRSDHDAIVDCINQMVFNVKEATYGALGNDTGNDGPLIQAAINAAELVGGIVILPPGIYRLASPLTINKGVTLRGAGWAGNHLGTYLHVVNNATMLASPAITVNGYGVILKDFAIEHDQPTPAGGWAPTAYPFTIKCSGTPELANDVIIENIFLYNSTKGIQLGDAAASIAVGRIQLTHIVGHVFTTGIQVDYALDTLGINDVHFWPFWSAHAGVVAYTLANCNGLILQRTDGIFLQDYFSLQHKVGLYLTSNAFGVTRRLQVANLNTDAIGALGILVDADETTAMISNFSATIQPGQADTNGLAVNCTNAQLQFTNFYVAGLGRRAVYVGAASRVDISNFRVEVWGQDYPATLWPAIEVAHGSAVVTLDEGATFSRIFGANSTPVGAPDVSGAGTVIQPGYRGFCHLRASGSQTVAYNTNYAIQFDVEVVDLDSFHDGAANTRVTVKRPGWYDVAVGCRFTYNATAGTRTVMLRKNGTTFVGGASQLPSYTSSLSTPGFLTHKTKIQLVAADYFEVIVYHDLSAVSLSLDFESGRSPELMMNYLGA